MKKQLPIGVFDSGIGGISVLKDIVALMPEENYIYYGDSAHAPYGTKSIEEIYALCEDCVRFLLEKKVKAIVIACNTATSASALKLRAKYPELPIIGIEPALKPAVMWKEHDTVLVMATPATIKQDKYQSLMHNYDDKSDIISVPCAGLMEFVERGETSGNNLELFLKNLISEHVEFDANNNAKIDAIVLGCTHYPFVAKAIQNVVGKDVKIFDGGLGTAKELRRRLIAEDLKNPSTEKGKIEIYNSNNNPDTIAMCNKLLFNT